MGSSLSLLFWHGNTVTDPPSEPALGDLPENCVASIIGYLDPPEICRLAMLNRSFRGASSADFVWESKLPLNYGSIVQRLIENDDEKLDDYCTDMCKRDVYFRLCRSNSFDGGSKKVWLDRSNGKICMSISSNGFAITGIDDRRYWSRIPTEESRFHSVAYVQQIWWFEVNGEVEFPFPAGSYSLFFRLQLGQAYKRFGRRVCNSEKVHGWDIKPVRFQLSTSDGQQATTQYYLKKVGKWIHYHAGDFVVSDSGKSTLVKFSMTQIDCTHTKGGLCVDSVVIYPSESRERLQCFNV
ncbi:F-box protein PP2-A12 [Abeliophyllum distichum]|uniref:F-box protein PP2-A12 n=1 Tax=Abeliophyllum distichum TaxID=126358 RepID=A0ABD1TW97_9LAMI